MEGVATIVWATTENVELFAEGGDPNLFSDEIRLLIAAIANHVFFNVVVCTMKKQHAASLSVRDIAVQENLASPVVFVFVQVVDGVRCVCGPRSLGHDVAKLVDDMEPRHGVPVFIFVSTGIDDRPYVFKRVIFHVFVFKHCAISLQNDPPFFPELILGNVLVVHMVGLNWQFASVKIVAFSSQQTRRAELEVS
jgi:hypothetical protein